MSYDQVYDLMRKLQEALEHLERDSQRSKTEVTTLEARVKQLEEELTKEKAAVTRQEKLLQHRLKTIKDLQQQRDSLRLKNAELDQRIAILGRKTSAGSFNSPIVPSFRDSYSSSSDSTASSEPSTPANSSLPPIPMNAISTANDSDTDTEEMDDKASPNGSGSGIVGSTHAIRTSDHSPPSPPKSTGNRASIATPPTTAAGGIPAAAETPRHKMGRAISCDYTGTNHAVPNRGSAKPRLHKNQSVEVCSDLPSSRATLGPPRQQQAHSHSPPRSRSEKGPHLADGSPSYQRASDRRARATDSSGATSLMSGGGAEVLDWGLSSSPGSGPRGQSSSPSSRDKVPMAVRVEEASPDPVCPNAREALTGTQVSVPKLATGELDTTLGETPKLVSGEEAPKPVSGEEAPKPVSGEEAPRQVSGDKASKLVSGEEAPSQVSGEEASKPVSGEEAPKLVSGEEASKQVSGEEAPKPVSGEEAPKPVSGEEAPKLVSGEEASKQVSGEEAPKPVSGEEAPKPVSGEEASKQVSGEEDLRQVSGEEAPKPVSGEEAPKPVSGEDAPKQVSGEEASPKIVLGPDSCEKTADVPKAPPPDTSPKPSPIHRASPQLVRTKQECSTKESDGRAFNRCQSESAFLLVPNQTSDDLAIIVPPTSTTTGEGSHEDSGFAEMRKRTNTFSPSSKPMVGRRTPKEIKKAESKAREEHRKVAAMSAARREATDVLKYLSPDMEAKIYEKICRSLGAKYGSLERATQAAVTIQKTYRGYKLRRHFEVMRKEGPSTVRKRTATIKDKNRKLSIKSRPMKTREEMTMVQETIDKINNKRHSPGRARATQRRQVSGGKIDETPPPLPPPLHPDDLPLQNEGASAEAREFPSGRNSVSGASAGSSPLMQAVQLTVSPTGSERSSTGEEQEDGPSNLPTSQSADLSNVLRRVSVFSLQGDVGVVGGGGGGRRLSRSMTAAMVKKIMNIGVYQFNRKPINGLQYLISAGVLQDTPESVAKFLRTQYGLSKVKIGEFLGEISMAFNMAVLEQIAASVDMKDKAIDEALREFQTLFRMPGEAQKIDKIMQIFAAEYVKANRGVFETEDGAYILSFSIMMLHTSLHNPSVRHKTSKEQWLKTNRGLNNDRDFPRQMLLDIYIRIQETQFVTAQDHTQKVMEIQQQLEGSDIRDLVAPHRSFIEKVVVYELDDINHWFKSNRHQRHLLIFSDLVIITKKNKKEHFQFRKSFSLFNAIILPFTTTADQSPSKSHKQGIQVRDLFDKTVLLQCTCETPEETAILMNKLNNTIATLRELEKERIEMLGSSVEMRRCSTNTSTEAAGDIMVMHCRPPGQRAARRRSSVDSVFVPITETAGTPTRNVARSMEDLTRLPSSCSSVSSSQNVEQARSTRFLNVIETPRSPSDGNLVGANAREALRVTKSSSPDTERAGRPVERTKSESVNKKSVTVKRNKTEKKKKK